MSSFTFWLFSCSLVFVSFAHPLKGDGYAYATNEEREQYKPDHSKPESYEYNVADNKNSYEPVYEYGKIQANDGYEIHDDSNAYEKEPSYGNPRDSSKRVAYTKQQTYRGKYEGHCGEDGFYYLDQDTFVMCSNNQAHMQKCAPGSQNSGLDSYNFGGNYQYRDFCDINLVDQGYGVQVYPRVGTQPAGNKNGYGTPVAEGNTYDEGLHDFAHAQSWQSGRYGDNKEPRDYNNNNKYDDEIAYQQQNIYHGKYEGYCGDDGFYYNDEGSFVICSNRNAYMQPCAPGSRNSGMESYNFGDNYNYRDFCDVNLVDEGYGVDQYGYEYYPAANGYHAMSGY